MSRPLRIQSSLVLAVTIMGGFAQGQDVSKLLPSRGRRPVATCGSTGEDNSPYTPESSLESQVVLATIRDHPDELKKLLERGAPAHAKALVRGFSSAIDRLARRPTSALWYAIDRDRWPQANLLVAHGALKDLDDASFASVIQRLKGKLEANQILRWISTPGIPAQRMGYLLGVAFAEAHRREDAELERGLHMMAKSLGAGPSYLTDAYRDDLVLLAADGTRYSQERLEKALKKLEHLLTVHGLNPNIPDADGVPVAFRAVACPSASHILPTLLDHGLNPNLEVPAPISLRFQPQGLSLMGRTLERKNLVAARLLAAKGFNPEKLRDRGQSLFFQNFLYEIPEQPAPETELDPVEPNPMEGKVIGGVPGGVVGGVVGGILDPIATPEAILRALVTELRVKPTNPLTHDAPILAALYRKGHLDLIKHYETHGARLHPSGTENRFLLAEIARLGRADVLSHGLNQWPKVLNPKGESGFLALAEASTGAAMRVLLQAGAPVRWTGKDLPSPVFHAAERDESITLRLLLEAGADPNIPEWNFGPDLPLSEAARHPKADRYGALLLKHGADPNREDSVGRTPLMEVIFTSENPSAVETLLAWGAHPGLAAKADGWTPLMEAATQNDLITLDLLRSAGAATDLRNAAGERALDVAKRGGRAEALWYLNQAEPLALAWAKSEPPEGDHLHPELWPSSIVNRVDTQGRTAVILLIKQGDWKRLEAFAKNSVDWAAKDAEGRTVLQLLEANQDEDAQSYREEIIRFLEEQKARSPMRP